MFESIPPRLKFVTDEPEKDNIQFDFSRHAKYIAESLTEEKMPTPFAIVIHGEWGSGKTTFLKHIMENLKIKDESLKTIEFDAWKYERTDIFAALLRKINKEFGGKDWDVKKSIARFGLDALLRRTINMTEKEVRSHFDNMMEEIDTVRDKVSKVVTEKLVIFIDDLDRCNVENTLSMLEDIKLFLTIDNIIVVVALDMDKVEKAWELQYDNSGAKMVGRDHTEKMFQLKIPVPPKSDFDIKHYIDGIVGKLDNKTMEFFANILPPNPRKIKLALNSLYLALKSERGSSRVSKMTEKQYIRSIMIWIVIANNHREIAKIAKISSSYLVQAAFICYKFETMSKFQQSIQEYARAYDNGEARHLEYKRDTIIAAKFMSFSLLKILKIVADGNQTLFQTLKHYGEIIEYDINLSGHVFIADEFYEKFEPHSELLEHIIDNMPTDTT